MQNVIYHEGKCKKYKPFWNPKLEKMKEERNNQRNIAETTKTPEDILKWRKQNARLRKEINLQKRATFNSFIRNAGYAPKGKKVYGFIKKLSNNTTQHQ